MKTPISFRLRKDLDADLIGAIADMDKTAIKELCRDGLRLMLGIRTTKAIEVTERPLNVPQLTDIRMPKPERIEAMIGSRTVSGTAPSVYIPKRS